MLGVAQEGARLLDVLPIFAEPISRAFTGDRAIPSAFFFLHLQSIMIIQPVDVLVDGRQNMCDGCPDMTVWNGELAWSCRLEECLQFGQFVRTVPKHHAVAGAPAGTKHGATASMADGQRRVRLKVAPEGNAVDESQ